MCSSQCEEVLNSKCFNVEIGEIRKRISLVYIFSNKKVQRKNIIGFGICSLLKRSLAIGLK